MRIGFWHESQKETDHWEDKDAGGSLFFFFFQDKGSRLKTDLKHDGVVWTGLIWL
jgi:hypothetical protein